MVQEVNVDCYEIDGKDYIVGKKIEYNGSTYVLLINEKDYTDSLVQKEVNDELEPVDDIELLHNILTLMKNDSK